MRYKHIVTVGTVLISIFVLLAVLMYYFNQDSCPVTTFSCKNSTKCIPQRNWCNSVFDCPEGDDESFECFDTFGYWDWIYDRPKADIPILDCPKVTKSDPGYFENCQYLENCTIYCTNFHSYNFPQTFSENVQNLIFANSSFPILKSNVFKKYSKLIDLNLDDNHIEKLENNVFVEQRHLIWLKLSYNKIEEISKGHLVGLTKLKDFSASNNRIRKANFYDFKNSTIAYIDLTKNNLTSPNLFFPFMPELKELYLDDNNLTYISDDLFAGLPLLRNLNLEGNQIVNISANAFKNTIQLKELNLMHNRIITIPPDLFKSFTSLSMLSMGWNPIENLEMRTFKPLKSTLQSLGLEEIDLDYAEPNLFNMFTKLEFVYFKKFHYCTFYVPQVKKCSPLSDGVSSLSHLLDKPLLRAAVWGISCATCLGNALVLWGRLTAKDENRVLSIVIRNLAVSDMLMGFYLLIVGLEDIRFRDNYKQEASAWMSSWSCTLLGMLAMTSSEVSVLILSFMSVERFMLIAAPLKGHRAITPQTAASSMIVVWVIGITLALVPVIYWSNSTRFYGLNGMCFPLHIDEPFLVGWEYSAFIFLGINFLGLIIIGYVYAGMFASIWKTRHATSLSVGDFEFAFRFFFIVLTYAVCWAPIVTLKVLAFINYPVAPDLHAWIVIFILPVNSAVNPLLYTFTTPKFRERLNEGWFGKIRNLVSTRELRSGSQTSNSGNRSVTLSRTPSIKLPNDEKVSKTLWNQDLLINILSKEN